MSKIVSYFIKKVLWLVYGSKFRTQDLSDLTLELQRPTYDLQNSHFSKIQDKNSNKTDGMEMYVLMTLHYRYKEMLYTFCYTCTMTIKEFKCSNNVCFCFSLQQASAPKLAMGGTWVAIVATAPCLGRAETRPHPDRREALSTVTPASRSPMCEVIGVRRNTSRQLYHISIDIMNICHVLLDMGWLFFIEMKM